MTHRDECQGPILACRIWSARGEDALHVVAEEFAASGAVGQQGAERLDVNAGRLPKMHRLGCGDRLTEPALLVKRLGRRARRR